MAEKSLIRLAVFGSPVAQSLSPRIHRLFARQCGLDIDYRATEATVETFPGHLSALAASGGKGCNVTVPLKRKAWELASRCSDGALLARAANTLVLYDSGEIYADNTDGPGLVSDLESAAPGSLKGARLCLLGAGGAASGVLGALLRAKPALIVIANRTVQRAAELAEIHDGLGEISVCMPADISRFEPFDLLINATSLGHDGSAPEVSRSWLKPDGLCYDMNYGPAAEPLKLMCGEKGIPYSDGLGMLVGQAALSFELWTGQRPDAAAVLKEL